MKEGIRTRLMLVLVFCSILLFSACDVTPKLPVAYYNTRWTAQEIDMYFEVRKDQDVVGCLNTDDGCIELRIEFGPGSNISFYPTDNNNKEIIESLNIDIEGELTCCTALDVEPDSFKCKWIESIDREPLIDGVTLVTFIREDID